MFIKELEIEIACDKRKDIFIKIYNKVKIIYRKRERERERERKREREGEREK